MSKAEEKAMEKYPPRSILIVPARRGGYYADSHMREGFIEGYHHAEKDNELTWEDMRDIYDLDYNLRFPHKKQKEFFEEVLKRFKTKKEK